MGVSGRARSEAGGIAAALVALLLLVGIIGLAFGVPGVRPWLAVLFGINGGVGGVELVSLGFVNPVDVVMLALAGLAFSGTWPGPARPHRLWMCLSILLPLAGIAVLAVTGEWGRSGLMGGGVVLSFLMLGSRQWRPVGVVGLAANLLLLTGDFATLGTRMPLIAGIIAVGYVLLLAWFLWMAVRLLRTDAGRPRTSRP
ncbi:hypothetical protein ACWGST_09870 [Agromyces sp. NPDC055520]